MVAIRCGPLCAVIPVVATATKAHGEGHIAFAINAALPSPSPGITPSAAAGPAASSGSGLSLGVPIAIGLLLLLLTAEVYRMQCPLEYVAVAVISTFSGAIGASCVMRMKQKDDWGEVANLWALIWKKIIWSYQRSDLTI